jgi:hypothetical protein
MDTILAWWRSEGGRRAVKWATTALGALVTSGAIPLDTPLFLGLSLGQVLVILGLSVPSTPRLAVVASPKLATPPLRQPVE